MATRCTRKTDLEIHHIDKYGEAVPSNAQVLCSKCHDNTKSSGADRDGRRPKKEFSATDKEKIKKDRNYQCECIKDNCH